MVFKRNKNLKEISTSLYTKTKNEKKILCHKKRDICENYLISDNIFTCKGTNKKYYINKNFDCNSMNVIYLTSCTNCNEQYVGSALENTKVTSTPKRTDVELLVITLINVGTHRIFVPS